MPRIVSLENGIRPTKKELHKIFDQVYGEQYYSRRLEIIEQLEPFQQEAHRRKTEEKDNLSHLPSNVLPRPEEISHVLPSPSELPNLHRNTQHGKINQSISRIHRHPEKLLTPHNFDL